jgi:hypothetical protein
MSTTFSFKKAFADFPQFSAQKNEKSTSEVADG